MLWRGTRSSRHEGTACGLFEESRGDEAGWHPVSRTRAEGDGRRGPGESGLELMQNEVSAIAGI